MDISKPFGSSASTSKPQNHAQIAQGHTPSAKYIEKIFRDKISDSISNNRGFTSGLEEASAIIAQRCQAANADMLAAVQAILASSDYSDDTRPLMNNLRAAIARATGA